MPLDFINRKKIEEIDKKISPEPYFDKLMTFMGLLVTAGVVYLLFEFHFVRNDIVTLNKELSKIRGNTTESQETNEGPKKPDIEFKIMSPTGGEKLIIGQEFIIKWKAPKNIQNVILRVSQDSFESFVIGTFPPNFNSQIEGEGTYVWKVGQAYKTVSTDPKQMELVTIPEGFGYEIGMSSTYPIDSEHNFSLGDSTDGVFSIVKQ